MDLWYTLDSPPVIPFRALEDVAIQMRRGGHHHHLLDSDLALAMAWERFSHLFYQTDTPVFLPHNNPDQKIEMIEDVLFHADLTLESLFNTLNEELDMVESEKRLGILPIASPSLDLFHEESGRRNKNKNKGIEEVDVEEEEDESNHTDEEGEHQLITPRQLISFYDERKVNVNFLRTKMRLASLRLE